MVNWSSAETPIVGKMARKAPKEALQRGTKTEKRDVIKKRSPNLAQREQKIGAVPLGWLKLIRSAFP
jgi:hypothetical protein